MNRVKSVDKPTGFGTISLRFFIPQLTGLFKPVFGRELEDNAPAETFVPLKLYVGHPYVSSERGSLQTANPGQNQLVVEALKNQHKIRVGPSKFLRQWMNILRARMCFIVLHIHITRSFVAKELIRCHRMLLLT